jgi:serine/threonine-protein kinase
MVYFIMEFLQGRSLSQVVREEAPLSPERSLGIALQIADALEASHKHHIVHRDLKPDNVILLNRGSSQDFVKVLDFGIAKLTGDQPGSKRTRTGIVMGTPAYMSPEQCEGKGLTDRRTDVYALGIVLYEMLTGQVPFAGEGYGEILVQHLTAIPPRPSTIRGVIPPHVEAVCMKALEKRADQRYPSMAEFILALRDPVGYVEARGGLAGFASVNLTAPAGTPLPSRVPLATPPPGTYGASPGYPQYATPAPGYATPAPGYATPAPGQTPTTPPPGTMTYAGAAPPRSRTGMFVAIGAVAVLAIGGTVFALKGGDAPAPATPTAAPAAPTPAAAAAAKKVAIKIASTPAGAEVYRGDIFLGSTPTEFGLDASDAPVALTLRAPGFAERTEKIVPSENRDLNLRLEAVTVAAPVAASPPATTTSPDTSSSHSSRPRSSRSRSGTSSSSSRTRSSGSAGNNTLAPDF